MSSRFQDSEKLSAAVRSEIPAVAIHWLESVRVEMEKLTRAALSGNVGDEEFRSLVEKTSKKLPRMLERMDHDSLATLMENAMGAAMANGIDARLKDARPRNHP